MRVKRPCERTKEKMVEKVKQTDTERPWKAQNGAQS